MIPRLKELTWQRVAEEMVVAFDPSEQVVLADPSGRWRRSARTTRQRTTRDRA